MHAHLASGIILLLFLAAGLSTGAPDAFGAEVEAGTKLELVLVSTQTVGDPSRDLRRVKEAFEIGVAAYNRAHMVKIGIHSKEVLVNPNTLDWKSLIMSIGNLPIDKKTMFVCYLKLHGGTERLADGTDEHQLFLDWDDADHKFSRKELIAVLESKEARFTALISDCCSAYLPSIGPELVAMGPGTSELFEDLFVRSSGTLDINASTFQRDRNGKIIKSELAWVDADGAVFTGALVTLLRSADAHKLADRNRDKRVTWQEFADQLKETTNNDFQRLKSRWNSKALPSAVGIDSTSFLRSYLDKQASQTPQVRALPN